MAIIDSEQILLIMLISIVLIVIMISCQKMRLDNNDKNNIKNNNLRVENFENNSNDPEDNLDELKKYMKIQGLYPMSKGSDMSKYVLKSQVDKEKACPDMSKYISKSAVPRQVKCPVINRDEWIKKTELPPNWNKECPKQPDLTNYVLKSTIPPTQECPACVCPKIKVNAGLCREPTKEDCLKSGVLKDACPKPEPCPVPQCPDVKPCPAPLPCPVTKCPKIPQKGQCPRPTRCPPSKDCPKCYGVKYVKVPVVKSEPPQKPPRGSIFPQNLIETRLVREKMPREPRQPKIVEIDNSEDIDKIREQLRKEIYDELKKEMSSKNTSVEVQAPSTSTVIMSEENMFPSFTEPIEVKDDVVAKVQKKVRGMCNKANLNNMFKKYGSLGFNNNM